MRYTTPGRKGEWIATYTGKKFHAFDPREEDICIEDIAQALSMTCRFSGHVNRFYSVAQHSVYVSYMVSPKNALVGLLHDAQEAYVTDIPAPIKRELNAATQGLFDSLEAGIYQVVAEKYGLPFNIPDEVEVADKQIVVQEAGAFFDPVPDWVKDSPHYIGPATNAESWTPARAKAEFLNRFKELYDAG